jgi:hypothetical protein
MKNVKNMLWALPLFSILFFTACEKDDPEVPNEEELITTLIYTLTPEDGGNGGNAPVIVNGTLAANTTYAGALSLLNETETPAESISEEVEEEADEHQFFFSASGVNATVSYADADGNGNPIGLASTVVAGAVSSGTLIITLRHEPAKSASGVSDGDITNAGGETDIEVTFDVTVQ